MAALVVIALIYGATRFFGGSDAAGYATRKVERGPLTVTVSATGKLAPTNQVQVGSELSGKITRVLVDVNDRVTAGQPLALIDPEGDPLDLVRPRRHEGVERRAQRLDLADGQRHRVRDVIAEDAGDEVGLLRLGGWLGTQLAFHCLCFLSF